MCTPPPKPTFVVTLCRSRAFSASYNAARLVNARARSAGALASRKEIERSLQRAKEAAEGKALSGRAAAIFKRKIRGSNLRQQESERSFASAPAPATPHPSKRARQQARARSMWYSAASATSVAAAVRKVSTLPVFFFSLAACMVCSGTGPTSAAVASGTAGLISAPAACLQVTHAVTDFSATFLKGTSGKPTDEDRSKQVLTVAAAHVATCMDLKCFRGGLLPSIDHLAEVCKVVLGTAKKTTRAIFSTWVYFRKLYTINTLDTHGNRRKRGVVILPEHIKLFKRQHRRRQRRGERTTYRDIVEMYAVDFGLVVGKSFCQRFVRTLGWRWGPLKAEYSGDPNSPRRLAQLRMYIVALDYHTKCENGNGTVDDYEQEIIVESDEFWAAFNLAHKMGLRDPGDTFCNIPNYDNEKLAACISKTKDGVLAAVIEPGKNVQAWGFTRTPATGAAAANPFVVSRPHENPSGLFAFLHKTSRDGKDYHLTGEQ